jgi:hypothetical protein
MRVFVVAPSRVADCEFWLVLVFARSNAGGTNMHLHFIGS